MITEDFNSREQHLTTEGITARLVYTATWDDWDTSGSALPSIGDILTDFVDWPAEYDDLICTDIKTITVDNTNVKIICLFSTENTIARQRRPDQAKSWKFDLLTDSVMQDIAGWPSAGDGSWNSWASIWEAEKPTGAPDEPMPLLYLKTSMTLRITIYSSFWLMPFLIEYQGTINDRPFLREAIDAFISDDNFLVDWANWDNLANTDIGGDYPDDERQWLLANIESERVGKNSWEYKLYLSHAGWDAENRRSNWDVQNGIGDILLYPLSNFFDILNTVSNLDDDAGGQR